MDRTETRACRNEGRFLALFENILMGDQDIPIPNPFLGETMLAEKVDSWIAAYKAEGKAEGRKEGMATILRRMKSAGMTVADIAKITGMQEEEVRHLI